MPFTKDATTYVEQQSKYFMTMALAGLPLELDYVQNQILSGSNVPNYEPVSEQMLRLATPHAFGTVSTPSPTESSAFASHYHGRDGRTGGRGGHCHGILCNYYNRYDHINVGCRTKSREKQRQLQVAIVAQPDINKDVIILVDDYNDFLQFKADHQPSSSDVITHQVFL